MKTGEDELVGRITTGLAFKSKAPLALGVGDDAALLTSRPGFDTVLTCDWSLQGRHFQQGKHPPDSVGWKCLARAISDVAAVGGHPRCFLLSLALPRDAGLNDKSRGSQWLEDFLGGMRRAARRFKCELAGGDTTTSDKIQINVTVVGEIERGCAVLRSGAKPGDLIYVSGRLGEAEVGLRLVRQGQTTEHRCDACVKKHLYPEPRLALGQWLADHRLATAMMDLSDGLSTDLSRLCAASRAGARIVASKVPKVQLPAAKGQDHLNLTELALHGGDDYELLFTVSPRSVRRIPRNFRGTLITCVGEITRERKLVLLNATGHKEVLPARGWDPFRPKKQRRIDSRFGFVLTR
jgi:thiamine-monophosphate kinase